MGLNEAPNAERIHIGFFGCRNAGKSSVVNAVTNQEAAVVSEVKGTTTDPVFKSMELLPLGPAVIIDTPGFDDVGALGEMRISRTKKILNKVDIAVLVVDAVEGIREFDELLIGMFKKKNIPYIIVYNKSDLTEVKTDGIFVSAATGDGIDELKRCISELQPKYERKSIAGDLVKPNDVVILVTPIDSAAPKGRLILPQQQTLRDLLDNNVITLTVRETELKNALEVLSKKPALVITDSQVFGKVSSELPPDIPLTSFSILMARFKGFLKTAVKGAYALDTLKDNDNVLICEGCTHHRQCNDIGTVKIPKWLREYTNASLNLSYTSGTDFPEALSEYKLIIHCGGCMLNEREMKYRMKCAEEQGIPFTNYGTAIAHINGILKRSLKIIPMHEL